MKIGHHDLMLAPRQPGSEFCPMVGFDPKAAAKLFGHHDISLVVSRRIIPVPKEGIPSRIARPGAAPFVGSDRRY